MFTTLAVGSLALTACAASAPAFAVASAPDPVAGQPPYAIPSQRVTGAELRATRVPELLGALNRARPLFLRSHAPRRDQPVVVYVNGVPMGSIDCLLDIPVIDVVDVVFVDSVQAAFRFGTSHAGGALLVRATWGGGAWR